MDHRCFHRSIYEAIHDQIAGSSPDLSDSPPGLRLLSSGPSGETCIAMTVEERILLIALNATFQLEREVICHLSLHLDQWWNRKNSPSALSRASQCLRLSEGILAKASTLRTS